VSESCLKHFCHFQILLQILQLVKLNISLLRALQQFESDFVSEALLIIRDVRTSEEDFEKYVNELKEMLKGIEIRGIEEVDNAVEILVLNGKEKEFAEKARKLRVLYELLSPSDVTYKHLEFYKWIICISIALNRYGKIGMRLEEIERMARKTYELIQKTIGIDKIEKIGELEISEELSKLEAERRPISAIKVLGDIERRTSQQRSDFYVSLRKEIEKIYEEMREKKEVTKEVIERIRSIQQGLEEREAERRRLKEIFPVFDVLRGYFDDPIKAKEVSEEIIQELKKRDLLSKESFLKKQLRKRIRRIIRESLIKRFGLVKEIDQIEDRIFVNLEEEYEGE